VREKALAKKKKKKDLYDVIDHYSTTTFLGLISFNTRPRQRQGGVNDLIFQPLHK